MPSSLDFVIAFGSAGIIAAISYNAYWAFRIRRALAVRLYRNQALGIGLVALFGESEFVIIALAYAYDLQAFFTFKLTPLTEALIISAVAFELVLFYWIDASILAARKSDPLLRDTFGWRRLRAPFWVLIFASIAVAVALPISAFHGNFSFPGILSAYSTFLAIMFAGALVLPVAASRSGDMTLRRNLLWFAFFVGGVFLSGVPSIVLSTNVNGVLQANAVSLSLVYLISLAAAFSLYRSVKSLVPLNRLPLA